MTTRRRIGHSTVTNKAPVITSNEALAAVIDTIFLACFLRQPRTLISGRLKDLYKDLTNLGLAVPTLPDLNAAVNLRTWATAKTRPTRKDREKGGGKNMEKLAQVDFVALTCALEMHKEEVMATEEEIAEAKLVSMADLDSMHPDATPQISMTDIEGDESRPPTAGPPAAREIAEEKPRITAPIFEGALAALQHHITFPDGLRERVFKLLCEDYGLTQEQSERVGIATAQNVEGQRLSNDAIRRMVEKEKTRLRFYEGATNRNCSHLLSAPLVPAPCQQGQGCKFMMPAKVFPKIGLPGSAFGAVDMSRSLPDLRGFTAKRQLPGREEFKVPMSTGPLTMDPELGKYRTTGFFIKMPPLKFS